MSQLPVLTAAPLERIEGLRHAFFTRQGGVSGGVYRSLNIGVGSKDAPDAVARNRARAAARFGQPPERLITAYQVHSARAVIAEGPFGERPQADALVTATPGLVLGVLTADCAPVLMADPEARVIGAAHAGWRGALGGVLEATLERMQQLGARPDRIVAAVGPCIAQASYEVGLEFLETFSRDAPGSGGFFAPGASPDKRQFDLPGFVLDQLQRLGVADAEWIGRDTYADEALFFSNRRAVHRGEPDYGRLLSAIMLEA